MGLPIIGHLAPRQALPEVDRGAGRISFTRTESEEIKELYAQELRELPLKIASMGTGREYISEKLMAEIGPLRFTTGAVEEPLRDWDFLASKVRDIVELLNEISNGRANKYVSEKEIEGGFFYSIAYQEPSVRMGNSNVRLRGTVKSSVRLDGKEAVRGFVSQVVSCELRETKEMRMEARWVGLPEGHGEQSLKLTPCLVVQGAQACAWAGLTLLMTENRIIKKCAYCGTPVDITDNHPNGKEWRTCERCRLLVNTSVKRHRDKIREVLQKGEPFNLGELRFNRRKSGTNPAFVREKIIQLMVKSGEATYDPERGMLHPIRMVKAKEGKQQQSPHMT